MLKDTAYKQFIKLSKKPLLVEITDVSSYTESDPGVWKDVNIEMGNIKYGELNSIDSFNDYLQKEKQLIFEEINDNLLIIVFPNKYLDKLLNELKTIQFNFLIEKIKNIDYNIYKNLRIVYNPSVEYWTSEEKKIFDATRESPSRRITLDPKKNLEISEKIAKFSNLHFNTIKYIYTNLLDKFNKEYGGYGKTIIGSVKKKPQSAEKVIAFKWTKNPEQRSILLHQYLSRNFIDPKTDFNILDKAFSGSVLNTPLKIKWIKKVNGKLSKPLIFKLIELLIDMKLIVDDLDDRYFERLNLIFVDHNGKQIRNWAQSESGRIQRTTITPQESELQDIINEFAKNSS